VDSAPDGERHGGDGGKAGASFDCLKGADTVETQRWAVSLMERDAEATRKGSDGKATWCP
jgi:hypothetical protein